jgi:Domain of Unknown Function (DUF1080)
MPALSRPIVLAAVAVAAAVGSARLPADDPPKAVRLFNGKDLAGFYTFLAAAKPGEPPLGKNNDPLKVFTVVDGAIRVSGEVFGGLTTEQEYENYRLAVEFKWGEKTFPPRADKARDSGVMLHCTGADGAVHGAWMEAIECQMIEGGTGDFALVAGKDKPKLTVEAERRDRKYYFKPGAPAVTLTGGYFNWFGRDPAWQDVKGFRGPNDVEKPVGQWNTLEIVCAGDTISLFLNGTTVNQGAAASHRKGKILFQSEGAEVFFRRIDLTPLK